MDRVAKVSITRIITGDRRFVEEHEAHLDQMAEHIIAALKSGKSKSFEVDDKKYMIVPYNPTIRVLCVGVSEIIGWLGKLCEVMGFEFTQLTNDQIQSVEIDRYTAVCCFAHIPEVDDEMLEVAMKTNCFYIGALGSKGYHDQRIQRLSERGFDEESISRIHSPIGLNIGSRGGQEIALSVISEIVKEFHNRSILNDKTN